MTRKSNRPTERAIDEAVAEILETMPEPAHDFTPDVTAFVYLWATDRMTAYLDDWNAHHSESRKGQRALISWLRTEPPRLEQTIKAAIQRLTRESGPAENDAESSE